MIKVVFRLAGAIFCGIIISLLILQNNSHVQQLVSEKIISTLEKDWNVKIKINKICLNFFTLSLYSENGLIEPVDDRDFLWSFDKCKIYVSPFDLIFKKKISLKIAFDHITSKTRVTSGKIDIFDHISSMFQSNDNDELRVRLNSIKFNNFDCEWFYSENIIKTSFSGEFCIAKKRLSNPEYSWDGYLNLGSFRVELNNRILIDNATGKMGLHYHRHKKIWTFESDCLVNSRVINPHSSYHLQGQWSCLSQVITLINNVDQTSLTLHGNGSLFHVTGKIPISLIDQVISLIKNQSLQIALSSNSKGFCSIDLNCSFSDGDIKLSGECNSENGSLGYFSWQSINFLCKTPRTSVFAGSFTVQLSSQVIIKSFFAFDFKKTRGLVRFSNKMPIIISQGPLRSECLIDADKFNCSISFDKKEIKSDYLCHIVDVASDEKFEINGYGYFKDGIIFTTGKVFEKKDISNKAGIFGLKAEYKDCFCLNRFIYKKCGDRLIDVYASKKDPYKLIGKLKYSLIHGYFDSELQRSIFGGNCIFDFVINYKNLYKPYGSIRLSSGRFYIPEWRNLITGCSIDFLCDFDRRSLILKDSNLRFCKGTVSSPQITISLDEKGFFNTVHVPLNLNNLFINWKRDFYGFIDGNFLISKASILDGMNISGSVVLGRSLLRDTLLSQDSLGNVSGPLDIFNIGSYKLGVDVAVKTDKPIRVTTDSLDTFANLDLRIECEQNNDIMKFPKLTGAISLDGGYLKFLKNKLFLEQGKIQFLCNQMNDPLVDIVAKNKINKYQIILQMTGSMQKPTIILESSPELTEEQVFGLLIAGSEQKTLQAALPGVLMFQLQKILFGSKKYTLPGASIIEKITKPLQYVQIAPNFTDLSGSGGIKGSFSVDLNDQLHAQVEKNFNLQDDFSFYLQYMLSDDVSLRAIKDQRGEIGSELEVRLKL